MGKGFGDHESAKKSLNKNSKRKSLNLSKANKAAERAVELHLGGDLDSAKALYQSAIEYGIINETIFFNLAHIYESFNCLDEAISLYKKSIETNRYFADPYLNLAGILKNLGELDKAFITMKKCAQFNPEKVEVNSNLGQLYKEYCDYDNAICFIKKALSLQPDNASTLLNLSAVYFSQRKFNEALLVIRKALKIQPDNSTALLNLGNIYFELGQFNEALDACLTSYTLDNKNLASIQSISMIIEKVKLNNDNAKKIEMAFEILLNQTCISHVKLSRIFVEAFLGIISKTCMHQPIIATNNKLFRTMIADWRIKKALTLLIPPNPLIEVSLIKLRAELLSHAIDGRHIDSDVQSFTAALAIQCFLNEYAYYQSPEEQSLVSSLLTISLDDRNTFIRNISVISCYIPICDLDINHDWLVEYSSTCDLAKDLVEILWYEPQRMASLKLPLKDNINIRDSISLRVKSMYESNPYPRYRFAEYSHAQFSETPLNKILRETSINHLTTENFSKHINSRPNVLIAGCGTGSHVIAASCYQNANITAIDLSGSSLAFAKLKADSYNMKNVTFEMMDLLNVRDLNQHFDIIECTGVLHHMAFPDEGLRVLTSVLNPGCYIKLGFYSKIARENINKARDLIKSLNIKSSPSGIRNFRKNVLSGRFSQLSNLMSFGQDFYSLSECRDLCFHEQEHQFTTNQVKNLLDKNGLEFCGFILPSSDQNSYKKAFPDDSCLKSLDKWGKFEEKNPQIFRAMYQFWAYKPH